MKLKKLEIEQLESLLSENVIVVISNGHKG